jgi:hypothetical protein
MESAIEMLSLVNSLRAAAAAMSTVLQFGYAIVGPMRQAIGDQ